MAEQSVMTPLASPPRDHAAEPFVNPGDQPEPADAAARGLTRRKVRHVASGETFHIWCAPPHKMQFCDEPPTN